MVNLQFTYHVHPHGMLQLLFLFFPSKYFSSSSEGSTAQIQLQLY